MAFIDITEPNSPIGIENLLRPYKRGEAEITPEVCMQVLQATNYARSLRDMLDCVAKLPDEMLARLGFKNAMQGILEGREQPEDIVGKVRHIANRGGYADEVPPQSVPRTAEHGTEALMSHFERKKVLYLSGDCVDSTDFSEYAKLVVPTTEDGTYSFAFCKNFPKDVDASKTVKNLHFDDCAIETLNGFRLSADADIGFQDKGVADGDYTLCNKVNFYHVEFQKFQAPKFADGGMLYIDECILGPGLDVSMLDNVEIRDITNCNDLKGMAFRDGAAVEFSCSSYAGALPVLDFSHLRSVSLLGSDMSQYETFPLQDGAALSLSELANFKAKLDVSRLDKVKLERVDFGGPASLQFKEGAEVDLAYIETAGTTDLKMCRKVNLSCAAVADFYRYDADKVDELVLKGASDFGSRENFSGCEKVTFMFCEIHKPLRGKFDAEAKVMFHGGDYSGGVDCGNAMDVGVYNANLANIHTAAGAKIGAKFVDAKFVTEAEAAELKRCDEVFLLYPYLAPEIRELNFKDGAKVKLKSVKFPEKVDFSGCSEVECDFCQWNQVKQVHFPDEQTYQAYRSELSADARPIWGKRPLAALQKGGRG